MIIVEPNNQYRNMRLDNHGKMALKKCFVNSIASLKTSKNFLIAEIYCFRGDILKKKKAFNKMLLSLSELNSVATEPPKYQH